MSVSSLLLDNAVSVASSTLGAMSLEKEEEIDQVGLARQLNSIVIPNWVGAKVAVYPAGHEEAIGFVLREFPNLMSGSQVELNDLMHPENMLDKTCYVMVTVVDIQAFNPASAPKKPIPFTRDSSKVVLNLNHDQQCHIRVGQSTKFFMRAKSEDRMRIEVHKMDGTMKLFGEAHIKLANIKEEERCHIKLSLNRIKVGQITLDFKFANLDCPNAGSIVENTLRKILRKQLHAILMEKFPKLAHSLINYSFDEQNGAYDDDNNHTEIETFIEVTEMCDESLKNSSISMLLFLNGENLEGEVLDETTRLFRVPVHCMATDVIMVEKVQWGKSSPFPFRKKKGSHQPMGTVSSSSTSSSGSKKTRKHSLGITIGETIISSVSSVVKRNAEENNELNVDVNENNNVPLIKSKKIFHELINASAVTLKSGFSLSHDKVKWHMKWVAEMFSRDYVDPKGLLSVLLHIQLSGMSTFERSVWNGKMDPMLEEILILCFMFLDKENFPLARIESAFMTYTKYPYNNDVLFNILKEEDARSIVSLDQVSGIHQYLITCAKAMARFDAQKTPKETLGQLKKSIRVINVIKAKISPQLFESSFANSFTLFCDQKWASGLRQLEMEDLKNVLVTLEKIDKEFGSFHFSSDSSWSQSLADIIMELLCQTLARRSPSEMEGTTSFNMYRLFRSILEHTKAFEEDKLFHLFEPYLSIWIETIHKKAKEQMNIVLNLESERHMVLQFEFFCKVDDIVREGLETTNDIKGIIKSCEITWRELRWPDLRTNLDFGNDLLTRIGGLFTSFVDGFMEIIMADDHFDVFELVIILNSISMIVAYIKELFGEMNQMVNEKGLDNLSQEVKSKIESFSQTVKSLQQTADKKTEQFIIAFLDSESRTVDLYIRQENVFKEDGTNCLLDHVNEVLEFLHHHLIVENETDEATKKNLRRITHEITIKIFDLLEEKVALNFLSTKQQARIKNDPEFEHYYRICIREIIAFRKNLDLSRNPRLATLMDSLNIKIKTTDELISMSLTKILNLHAANETDEVATLTFEIDTSNTNVVHIELKSLSSPAEIELHNPCIVMKIEPKALDNEDDETQAKTMTSVYENSPNILYDLLPGDNKLTLKVPPDEKRKLFLSFELYDHSKWKTHKVFKGTIMMELEPICRKASLQKLKETIAFRCLPEFTHSDTEWLELNQRKDSDPKAAKYVKKYLKHLSGSRIPVKPKRHNWVKNE